MCAPEGAEEREGGEPKASPNQCGPSRLLPFLQLAPTDEGFTFTFLQNSVGRRWLETGARRLEGKGSSPSQAFGCPDNDITPPTPDAAWVVLSEPLSLLERGWAQQ